MCYVGPTMKFLYMCWLGVKFGMVILDTCIDGVGGFPESNIIIVIILLIIIIITVVVIINIIIIIMTNTNNSSNKNHTYRLINVLRGANVEFFIRVSALFEIIHSLTKRMH